MTVLTAATTSTSASIRTVNLLWEKRVRGAYPVARCALDDQGRVTLALPRPLEARAYDLTRLALDGSVERQGGFAVETLLKLEISADSDNCLGMTADDIYLFRADSKARFLGERRVSFVDAALDARGQSLAAGFSDLAGGSFALALGEIGGRVIWTREMDLPLTAVAISRDGTRIAVGGENGGLRLMDAARRDIWVFEQPEPVRALACSVNGVWTAYGTREGTVGLIDGEGRRVWEAQVPGEVFAVVLADDGGICAALSRAPGDITGAQITCLSGNGQIGWEFDAEKRLLGLSLSPDGRYLATGARDGTTTVYAIVVGENLPPPAAYDSESAREEAESRARSGDWAGALQTLDAALNANPTDTSLCALASELRGQWRDAQQTQAQELQTAGRFADLLTLCDGWLRDDPNNLATRATRSEAQAALGRQHFARAQTLRAENREEQAETALLEAIALAPYDGDVRSQLAALRADRAATEDAKADRLLAAGDLAGGAAALERAQTLMPTPARLEKLRRAQTAQEFAEGLDFYNEKRYGEAIFQFKKVLARDAGHAEAKRYLGYAQKFVQEGASDSLNDRFSRLE